MTAASEAGDRRFFFTMRHFQNGKPMSKRQFLFCTVGTFLVVVCGGAVLSDPIYCEWVIDCSGSSILSYKVSSFAKFSPESIPYFWSLFLAYAWSVVSFTAIIFLNFKPQPDIVLALNQDKELREQAITYFVTSVFCYGFLFVPIEVVEGQHTDFAGFTFFPLILFVGTAMAIFAAFPIVFFGMLVKALLMRRRNEKK